MNERQLFVEKVLSQMTDSEVEALLSVATLYVDSFKDDESMSLPELMRFQEVEAIVDRYGRRS